MVGRANGRRQRESSASAIVADPKPLVVLLTTGGTMATTRNSSGGRTAPTLGGDALSLSAAIPEIDLSVQDLGRTPSWALDPPAMARIALAARDAAREPSVAGVVVTHGTSTLEYTAFLTAMVLDVDTPVVLTGAMRRADDLDPDGPSNLADAIRVAASPRARGLGALVVFAGRIIAASQVWKARRTDLDAFVALDQDLGRVVGDRIEIHGHAAPGNDEPRRPIALSGLLESRVAFVKVVPGADGRMIEAAIAGDCLGLAIEGLPGVGGIPPAMQPAVALAASRMPVVLASRAPFGRLPERPTGGTGEPLREMGLLSAGSLTAEQAWLLLMAVLGDGAADPAVGDRFRAVVKTLVPTRTPEKWERGVRDDPVRGG